MRQRFVFFFLVLLAVAGLGYYATAIEPASIQVRRYEVAVDAPALKGLRVAVISDLHAGAPHIDLAKIDRIVAMTNAAKPDVILLAGGGTYRAPAQLVGDFIAGTPSTGLGEVLPSYRPGVTPTDLSSCLPDYAIEAIREALPAFGRQIKGFDRSDAVLTGVETRTSSPIRIQRGEDFQSLNTQGLYPAGEGAGFAGGILSAAVDGIRVAEAVAKSIAKI
jgi:hypothetical protein